MDTIEPYLERLCLKIAMSIQKGLSGFFTLGGLIYMHMKTRKSESLRHGDRCGGGAALLQLVHSGLYPEAREGRESVTRCK